MKSKLLKSVLLILTLASVQSAWGFFVQPTPCYPDYLPLWEHDLDPQHQPVSAPDIGTNRGRNAWWTVCQPGLYAIFNPTGTLDGELSGNVRWYPTFGVPNGQNGFTTPGNWRAPTKAPVNATDPSCAMPAGYEFVGLCDYYAIRNLCGK
jgi:hypothetical protein